MRQQLMSEPDGLAPLKMRVARNQRTTVRFHTVQQSEDQRPNHSIQIVQSASKPQANVRRDLIISGPSSVESSSDRPNQLMETPLYGHVNVFLIYRSILFQFVLPVEAHHNLTVFFNYNLGPVAWSHEHGRLNVRCYICRSVLNIR